MSAVYEHILQVTPEMVDVNGHANNVVYLQWLQDAADQKVVAEAETDWVLVDAKTGRPRPVTEAIRQALPVCSEELMPGNERRGKVNYSGRHK